MEREKLEQTLINIFNTICSESEEEALHIFRNSIYNIKHSKKELKDPENFNAIVQYRLNQGMRELIKSFYESSTCNDQNKVIFIYENYTFLELHIENLCFTKGCSSCRGDKSRYILNIYLNYAITGKISNWDPTSNHYWIPKFGDSSMWIAYCNSLYELFYGKTDSYLKAYQALIDCEVRKVKYIIHRWFMKLTDETVIEFAKTWDDDITPPYYRNKGEYYILPKSKVKDKGFEPYKPIDEREKTIFSDYVKIPKSNVKEIYKKSEEKFV